MKLVKQTHEVKINFLDKEYTTDIHETDDGYFIGNIGEMLFCQGKDLQEATKQLEAGLIALKEATEKLEKENENI